MVERRKIRTEKGLALVPGANKLSGGCNFAVKVPEAARHLWFFYKKRSRKPFVEIPFTQEERIGNMYALSIPDFQPEAYEYNFMVDGKVTSIPVRTGFWEERNLVRQWMRIFIR